MIVVDDSSDSLNVGLWLMFSLSIDGNVLHIVDDLLRLFQIIVMQGFKELLPSFLHVRELLIGPSRLFLPRLFVVSALLDIRIADRVAYIASLLLLHLLLPHQVVDVLLQLRKPVQHYILELVTVLQLCFLVLSGKDVATRRVLEVGFLSKRMDVDLRILIESIQQVRLLLIDLILSGNTIVPSIDVRSTAIVNHCNLLSVIQPRVALKLTLLR